MEEVDHDDPKMRLFAQSLSREEKRWFKDLPARSIPTFEDFQTLFLDRWEEKKSPLQILFQYNNLKKGNFESVHEFSNRFMRVYNSIPTDIKPLVGVAKLHYADAFESDFALLLRERKSASFPSMFKDDLEVEENLMDSGKLTNRVEADRRRQENQPSTSAPSSSNDAKFETMMKTMERLMDMMALDNIPPNRE